MKKIFQGGKCWLTELELEVAWVNFREVKKIISYVEKTG